MDLIYRNLRSRAISIGVVLIAATFVVPTGAAETESFKALRAMGKAFASIAQKASPAVVNIVCEKERGRESSENFNLPQWYPFDEDLFDMFRRGPRGRSPHFRRERARGTGFIISPDGYLLTNNHLVSDAKDGMIEVTLSNGKELKAKVIGTDPGSDVAVAKIDRDEAFPFIKLADSDALEVGEWVLAIGNSFGLSHTVTFGIVSAKGRHRLALGRDLDFQDFIQTDAAINPGNSGGPLLNLDGEAVGINTALAGPSGVSAGIGFAIPSNMAQGISDQLIATGTVRRGFLGIQMGNLTNKRAEALKLKNTLGALVESVLEGTAAAKAGLEPDDVIVEVNGRPIDSNQKLLNNIAMLAPETSVRLTVMRNGRRKFMTAILGERSERALARLGGRSGTLREMGLEVMNISPEIREALGEEDLQGVMIRMVTPQSSAAQEGLRAGTVITKVNRTPVDSRKKLNELVEDAVDRGKETILFIVTDGSGERMVHLRLPKE
ncbi:MAG: Do family serine endopeptidase [Planctomycetes bacterium]|nr:Do family serine endopeptidase [Planctomycetota bacterium]